MSARLGPSGHLKHQRPAQAHWEDEDENEHEHEHGHGHEHEHDQPPASRSPASPPRKAKRKVTKGLSRSRSGCFTCRLRRKKCDENHPSCGSCTLQGVSCEYKQPSWWISPQAKKLQTEKIKARVKETRTLKKDIAFQEFIKREVGSRRGAPSTSIPPTPPVSTTPVMPSTNSMQPQVHTYDGAMPYIATPLTASMTNAYMMPSMYRPDASFDTGLATEFDNGVGSSTYAQNETPVQPDLGLWFNPMATPIIPTPISAAAIVNTAATTPALQADEWYHGFTNPPPRVQSPLPLDDSEISRPLSCYLEVKMSVNDRERYLLYHFVDNVLKLVYPILDLHKQGASRAREILHSLDTNKSYYHCCLSVAAIHLKTVKKHRGKQVDKDIMQHRAWAIRELTRALIADHGHDKILDATLAMLLFTSSVASSEIDGLLDIPWNEHLGSVTNLVNKLGIIDKGPYTMSVSLSTWIDILGSTLLGKSPQFANTYRNKHLSGVSSGLRELMGCDDGIMYLISEVACLDGMKQDGLIDDYQIMAHAAALNAQLDHAEQSVADPKLESPHTAGGLIEPAKLTKNMTAIFRLAARIYLYSLTPNFHPEQQHITELVEAVAENLRFIPSGAFGFDRSLVWPMLITGANSTPSSNFRLILEQRIANMGNNADFGSFGRMYTVLQETWNLSDDNEEPIASASRTMQQPNLAGQPCSGLVGFDGIAMPASPFEGVRRVKRQPIHWRDVMRARDWQYLLL